MAIAATILLGIAVIVFIITAGIVRDGKLTRDHEREMLYAKQQHEIEMKQLMKETK